MNDNILKLWIRNFNHTKKKKEAIKNCRRTSYFTNFYRILQENLIGTYFYSSLLPIIPRSVTISNLKEFDARTCVPDGRCNYEPAPVPARVSIEKGREEKRACSNQNSILRVTFWPVVARLVFPFQPVDPPFRFFSGRASQ